MSAQQQHRDELYTRGGQEAVPASHLPSRWIELSRSAFRHNVEQLSAVGEGQQLAVVVKANAYGHGLEAIGSFCEEHPAVTFLCTSFLSEALALRASGITKPIMVMCSMDADLCLAAHQNIHFFVSNELQIHELSRVASITGAVYSVHLKVDTGLSRFGVQVDQVARLAAMVARSNGVAIAGVCTHFADSQIVASSYMEEQHKRFVSAIAQLKDIDTNRLYLHCANSSALLRRVPGCNLARVGIAAYGLWPSREIQKMAGFNRPPLRLRPVLSLKTRVIAIQQCAANVYVGYRRLFRTSRPTRLAILPVGYADGYAPRFFDNAAVCFGDNVALVVGAIAMNTVAVDITDLSVTYDAEATLIGLHPTLSLECRAERSRSNIREIVVGLSPLVPRGVVP